MPHEYTPTTNTNYNIMENSSLLTKVINTAKSALGVPYQWGGNSLQAGVDCSGLTQQSYLAAGISIPRVADDQYRASPVKLARDELVPGDLVFFKKSNSSVVHHTGLYLGNDKFIHAPHTGDVVKIATLSSRSDFYAGGRWVEGGESLAGYTDTGTDTGGFDFAKVGELVKLGTFVFAGCVVIVGLLLVFTLTK